jgi:hypothetical protein
LIMEVSKIEKAFVFQTDNIYIFNRSVLSGLYKQIL